MAMEHSGSFRNDTGALFPGVAQGRLEDKTVEMIGWRERERALEILRLDRATWEHEFGGPKST